MPTGEHAAVAKQSEFKLDFADGQTFAGHRACEGVFLESPMLDERFERTLVKTYF